MNDNIVYRDIVFEIGDEMSNSKRYPSDKFNAKIIAIRRNIKQLYYDEIPGPKINVTEYFNSFNDNSNNETLGANELKKENNFVQIHYYVTEINNNLFYNNRLKINNLLQFVYLPYLTKIEENTFRNCIRLTEVYCENVLSIGNNAFNGCSNLKHIYFPNVETIGESCFENCIELTFTNIPYNDKLINLSEYDEKLSLNFFNVTAINSSLSKILSQSYMSTPIEKKINNNLTLKVFQLLHLHLNKLISIGKNAFRNCKKLSNVIFPSLLSIDEGGFDNCTRLINFKAKNLKKIGKKCFMNCVSLKELDLPSTTIINSFAFDGCNNLRYINMPMLVNLEENVFRNTIIENLILPESFVKMNDLITSINITTLKKLYCLGDCPENLTIKDNFILSKNNCILYYLNKKSGFNSNLLTKFKDIKPYKIPNKPYFKAKSHDKSIILIWSYHYENDDDIGDNFFNNSNIKFNIKYIRSDRMNNNLVSTEIKQIPYPSNYAANNFNTEDLLNNFNNFYGLENLEYGTYNIKMRVVLHNSIEGPFAELDNFQHK